MSQFKINHRRYKSQHIMCMQLSNCLNYPNVCPSIPRYVTLYSWKKGTFRTAIGCHITKCLERVATSFWIHPIFPVSCRIAGCYDVLTRFSSSCRDRPQESYGKEIAKDLARKAKWRECKTIALGGKIHLRGMKEWENRKVDFCTFVSRRKKKTTT